MHACIYVCMFDFTIDSQKHWIFITTPTTVTSTWFYVDIQLKDIDFIPIKPTQQRGYRYVFAPEDLTPDLPPHHLHHTQIDLSRIKNRCDRMHAKTFIYTCVCMYVCMYVCMNAI